MYAHTYIQPPRSSKQFLKPPSFYPSLHPAVKCSTVLQCACLAVLLRPLPGHVRPREWARSNRRKWAHPQGAKFRVRSAGWPRLARILGDAHSPERRTGRRTKRKKRERERSARGLQQQQQKRRQQRRGREKERGRERRQQYLLQ